MMTWVSARRKSLRNFGSNRNCSHRTFQSKWRAGGCPILYIRSRDSFVRQSVFYYSALKKQPKMQTSQTFTSGTQFGVRFYSKTHFFICSKYKNAGYYFDGKLGETLRKKRKWKVSTPQNDSSAHSELV